LYADSVAVSLFNWVASLTLIGVDNQRVHAVTLSLTGFFLLAVNGERVVLSLSASFVQQLKMERSVILN